MQVSVETLKGLQRKIMVTVPVAEVDGEVNKKLNSLKTKIKVDGFRQGKAPVSVIKKRYGDAVRADVLGEIIQKTFGEALDKENIKPAGNPEIDMGEKTQDDQDFIYTAKFEVYPEIELADNSKIEIENPKVEIGEDDVNQMIEKLRSQHKEWNQVKRKSQMGDQLTISFKGLIDGEEFQGGRAESLPVELGSNSMIDGFESGLVGLNAGDKTTLDLKFPDNYHQADFAGKDVKFDVKVEEIEESQLPEVNDKFAKKFGVKAGGVDKLKQQIKTNMQRERDQYVRQYLKNQVTEALHDNNSGIEIPDSLIEQEIKGMVENLKQQMQGGDISNLPDSDNMKKEAERRVRLGMVMGEVIEQNKITLDDTKLNEFIEAEAASYEDPKQFIDYYKNNNEATNSLKPLVLEQQVVENIMSEGKVTEVAFKFQELIDKLHPP